MVCTACGEHNATDVRFCATCGQPLSSGPSQSQIANPHGPQHQEFHLIDSAQVELEVQSFKKPARITLILYFALWLPGLISNIVYLKQSRALKRNLGHSPEGHSCLWALLVFFITLPILAVCIWIAILAAAASSLG